MARDIHDARVGDEVDYYDYTTLRTQRGRITATHVSCSWANGRKGVEINGSLTRCYDAPHANAGFSLVTR